MAIHHASERFGSAQIENGAIDDFAILYGETIQT
jgi:hypothetical protein